MKRIPLNKADYYETFPAYLDGISRKFGEKPAITYFTRKQEAVTASYAQLTQQALCAAHALQARGYAGKHLAIVAENSVIGERAKVGASPDGSEDWGVAVVAQHLTIGPDAVVSPKAMITRNVKGGGVK